MRLFLQSILTFTTLVLCLSCNTDEPTGDTPTPNDKVEGVIRFSDERSSQRALSLNIISDDPDMEYIILLAQKKHFILNEIDSQKKLVEDDYFYVQSLANQYNIEVRDFLQQMGWLVKGNKMGYSAMGLYPDTEYVVYCYGVEFTDEGYEATTEIFYDIIKTAGPVAKQVEFDITCTIDGNLVDVSIDPNDYDGYYFYLIVPETWREYISEGEEMDSTHIEMLSNITFDRFNQWQNIDGTPIEQFCFQGQHIHSERLEPNTNYMVVAFAVSDDTTPLLCSVPAVKHFTSGDYAKTSLKLDIEVTDITPYSANLNLRPSNNSEEYTCIFIAKSQLPLVDSDYQLMKALANGFQPSIFTGPIKNEYLGPLMPQTEYVVLAFGLDGNIPTTDLYQVHFSSLEATDGATQITDIELIKLFDAEDIIAIDPSYRRKLGDCECVAIVEATTNEPCDKLYFWWYEEWMKVGYSEEAFLEDLLMYSYANNPEIMDMYYSMGNDDLFFFAGIAEDEKGNLGDIYYGDAFVVSRDMVSPADEFFSYVTSNDEATPTTSSLRVVGIRR
ncbi:MAG: hypothetical protein IJE99_06450 [Alistipes sp.]|nr:hypothetical protein [Alistipes sp.]